MPPKRLYDDRKWHKASAAYRSEHPVCEECIRQGKGLAARVSQVVDHVRPHKGDVELFWDRDNWQALCKQHHDAKTAREDRKCERYVVTGQPGSGKTTWVTAQRKTGWAVWDWDAIAGCMFGADRYRDRTADQAECGYAMRKELIRWLQRHKDVPCAIIVTHREQAQDIADAIGADLVQCTYSHVGGYDC